jgi:hypothetical protein
MSSAGGSCSGTMPRLTGNFRTSSFFLTCSRAIVGSVVVSEPQGTTIIYRENTKQRKREKELSVYISCFRYFALS